MLKKLRNYILSLATEEEILSYIDGVRPEMQGMAVRLVIRHNMATLTTPGVSGAPEGPIVSLTSFGVRIPYAAETVESLMEQTVLPSRIILWVGHDDISRALANPSLQRLMKRGLEVRETTDVGPATKLLPALKAFPSSPIITVDDDVIYDFQLVERLMYYHRKFPDAVIANHSECIAFDSTGSPYMNCEAPYSLSDGPLMTPSPLGVGGVLYPPGVLDDRVFDTELMMRLAPRADDLWFKAIELIGGTPVVTISAGSPNLERNFPNRRYPEELALCTTNLYERQNDVQVKALFDYFDLYGFYK